MRGSRRRNKSRLGRHLRKIWLRQAVIFLVAAGGIVVLLIQWGIPVLIRLAVFLGDLKTANEPVAVEDTIPPIAPRFQTMPTATYSASLSLRGFAESGSTVMIYLNDEFKQQVVTDAAGNFGTENLALNVGVNKIWAKAVDQAGNTSPESAAVSVDVDQVKPELTIEAPSDQTTTSAASIEVKGKVSKPEARVTVSGRMVTVDSWGGFSTKVNLNPGDNKILVTVIDRAGNQASRELTVKRQE